MGARNGNDKDIGIVGADARPARTGGDMLVSKNRKNSLRLKDYDYSQKRHVFCNERSYLIKEIT